MDLASILAATDNRGDWHFGIGDPTPIGWFTVVAYALATLACGGVWAADRRSIRQGRLASPLFWMVLTLLLLFLGINKQLDLQTLLNDVGRRLAKSQGWYARRRIYQVIFIAIVTAAGLVILGVFSWLGRKEWRRNFVALLGTVFLYVFVLIRASSIHHVDLWLRWTWRRLDLELDPRAGRDRGGRSRCLAGPPGPADSRESATCPPQAPMIPRGRGGTQFVRGVLVDQGEGKRRLPD